MRHGGVVGDRYHLQAAHRQAFDGRLHDKTGRASLCRRFATIKSDLKPEPCPMTLILNVLDVGFLVVNLTESKRKKLAKSNSEPFRLCEMKKRRKKLH